MDYVTMGFIAYFLGGILSVVYPYFTTWLETGESFDWRYVVSRILAVVLTGLTAIIAPGFVTWLVGLAANYDYPALYFIAVLMTTFGAGQFGRESEKLLTQVVKRL